MHHERISIVGAFDPISAGLRFQFHGSESHFKKFAGCLSTRQLAKSRHDVVPAQRLPDSVRAEHRIVASLTHT
jgi:hypothetical protein